MLADTPGQEVAGDRATRYYRWAFWLFGGYLVVAVVLALILLAAITDANAGLPSLFFAGVYAAAGLPVFVACAILAVASLAKREPYRLGMVAVLLVSCAIAWTLSTRIIRIIWQQLT